MLKWTGDGRDDVAHLRGSANLLYNAFRRRCDNNRDRRLLWREVTARWVRSPPRANRRLMNEPRLGQPGCNVSALGRATGGPRQR